MPTLAQYEDADGQMRLTAPDDAVVRGWMDAVGANYVAMDGRTRAAYVIGDLAAAIGTVFAAMGLSAAGVPDVVADRFGARQERYAYGAGASSGTALRFRLSIAEAAGQRYATLEPEGIGRLIEALHAPVIEMLRQASGLGKRALWRLVGDAIAVSWLDAGKAAGRERQAMDAAWQIIQRRGSPMANRQLRFVEMVVHDEADPMLIRGREWFRARGGCCRYYKTAESEGVLCTTCVLRTSESRDQRLRMYLAARLDAAR